MNYLFKVNNEIIKPREDVVLYVGNINTYSFEFLFDYIWDEYEKFVSFIIGDKVYNILIKDNKITVPNEVLEQEGKIIFGVFGTNGEDDIKRISSNLIEFNVLKGAYSPKTNEVLTPTPDFWEILFKNSIPKIIDGMWYIYDISKKEYINTNIIAKGTTPKKGEDYFTDSDISSLGINKKADILYVDESIQQAILDSWEEGV